MSATSRTPVPFRLAALDRARRTGLSNRPFTLARANPAACQCAGVRTGGLTFSHFARAPCSPARAIHVGSLPEYALRHCEPATVDFMIEQNEPQVCHRTVMRPTRLNCDFGRRLGWIAKHARRDGRRRRVLSRLEMRPHCVNHVARRQSKARRDACLTSRTPHLFRDLGNGSTGMLEIWTRSRMDGAIDPTSTQHPFVGCIDDCIDRDSRDVAPHHR